MHIIQVVKKIFFIYSKYLKRKKLYYFTKFRIITLILKNKNNRMKKHIYHDKTFNKLFYDYTLRNKKKEKLKNNYLMNESEFYPFSQRFTHSGYFAYPNKIFPSVNNFGKNYYYSNNDFPLNKKINSFNHNYTQRRNITEDEKNYEENKNKNNLNLYNLKGINKNFLNNKKNQSLKVNKNINDQLSKYLKNSELLRNHNFLNKTNPNIAKKSNEKQSFLKSNRAKSKKENNQISKTSHKLLYKSNKNLNPSSLGGLELAKTNYTNTKQNSNINIRSGNNILSNVNSASSGINNTNNNSNFLNGIKMISGNNEFFYDFNPYNRNMNKNEQKTELTMQSLSDSKMLELAGRYVNEEDNSSENYQMNNILHSKKKYKSRINQ